MTHRALLVFFSLCAACGSSGMQGSRGGDAGDAAVPGDDASASSGDAATRMDAAVVPATSGITVTVEPDGTNVAQNLLTAIEGATSAVHVEMYILTSPTYLAALKTLHDSGVEVKVVLNQTFPSGTATSSTNASSYSTLMSDGIDVHWSPTTTGFDSYTHEKTVVIDPGTSHAQAWIMTMNLDVSAPKYNREYLALDTLSADVAEAEAIFQADYAATSITPAGSLVVAPSPENNAQSRILALVESATTSIDVECEEYDAAGIESQIATALENQAKAGIAVRMVIEDSTDSSQASAVAALQKAGGKVVGYAYSSTSLDIHAKAIVVDGTTAFIGSENLSGGSLGFNRELGVLFSTPSEVQKVSSTIAADFAGGTTYSSK